MESKKREALKSEQHLDLVDETEEAIEKAEGAFKEVCKKTEEGEEFLWLCESYLKALHENLWAGHWNNALKNLEDIQKRLNEEDAGTDKNIKSALEILVELVEKRRILEGEDSEDDE